MGAKAGGGGGEEEGGGARRDGRCKEKRRGHRAVRKRREG